MKIVQLNRTPTLKDSLEVLDQVRIDIMVGKIDSFFLAGVASDDCVYAYVGSSKPVSRLRMEGAMSNALHMFQHGEV